jgi:hypothetical protein
MALGSAIALGAGLVYACTFQTRFYGDGPGLASLHALGLDEAYYNVLYLRAARAVRWFVALAGVDDPFASLRMLSVLPAALGLGATFVMLRAAGAEMFGALAATLALGASPALWFFATTIEVHALDFATVAGVALSILVAPWRRPARALALVAVAFPFPVWAHVTSATLGPGFVFLVQSARTRRTGERYSLPALLFGVGGLLFVVLLLALLASHVVRTGSLAGIRSDVLVGTSLKDPHAPEACPVWSREWILPYGALVPLALVGFARLRREPGLAAAIALALGVPLAFFLWWGVCERGGYFLGSAPFLLVPVAFLAGRWSPAKSALAAMLVAGQGLLARQEIAAFDRGFDPRERVERVREAIGDSGLLITVGRFAPDIRCYLPGVEELVLLNFVRQIRAGSAEPLSSDELVRRIEPRLEGLLERWGRVVLEPGPEPTFDETSAVEPDLVSDIDALFAHMRARYEVRDLPHPDWPLMVLVRAR